MGDDLEAIVLGRVMTENVSARGVYVRTAGGPGLEPGARVQLEMSVPHAPSAGGDALELDLRAMGTVVRIDPPSVHGMYGEDGESVLGVAIELDGPLSFRDTGTADAGTDAGRMAAGGPRREGTPT
jgi:hypothetical protein